MANEPKFTTSGQNSLERKNYSRFIAQAAKNIVKKKLVEIRHGGARAADELIDQLLSKSGENSGSTYKKSSQAGLEALVRSELDKDRGKWRNFIIEAAMRFDADALACFGVNFVYGGLITSSAGNTGWAAIVDADARPQDPSSLLAEKASQRSTIQRRSRALSELVSRGRARGTMVWIIEGKGLFSAEMLKTYRFEPDIAFILLEKCDKNGVWANNIPFNEIFGLKNVLTVIPENESSFISEYSRREMLYAVSSSAKWGRVGNSNNFSCSICDITHGRLPDELMSFIKNPSFPICADGIFELFNTVECILSGEKSKKIPEYKV